MKIRPQINFDLIRIESDVPPPQERGFAVELAATFRKMAPGDSIQFRCHDRSIVYAVAKLVPCSIITRTLRRNNDGSVEIRVWRVHPPDAAAGD